MTRAHLEKCEPRFAPRDRVQWRVREPRKHSRIFEREGIARVGPVPQASRREYF